MVDEKKIKDLGHCRIREVEPGRYESIETIQEIYSNIEKEKEKIATLVCQDCGRTQLLSKEAIEIILNSLTPAVFQCQNKRCMGVNTKVIWTTPAKKEAFRKLSSQTALRYWQNGGWSSFELEIKEVLEKLGLKEQEDYWHNFKLHSPTQSYYSLDFFFPSKKLVIEANGFVWHQLGNSVKKDVTRTRWLERLGFKVITLHGEEFNDHQKLQRTLMDLLDTHMINYCPNCQTSTELAGDGDYEVCPSCGWKNLPGRT